MGAAQYDDNDELMGCSRPSIVLAADQLTLVKSLVSLECGPRVSEFGTRKAAQYL